MPLGRDLDRTMDGPIDGAAILVNVVHALDDLRWSLASGEVVGDVDALDHEHVAFELELSDGVGGERLDPDFARCQRACKRAGQSAGGSGNDVVERCRVRGICVRPDAIMLGDRTVHAEGHRLLLARQPGKAYRSALLFDVNLRPVYDLVHHSLLAGGAHGTAD